MLLQRAGTGTIPPPDFIPPNWASLAEIWDAAPKPAIPTVTLGPATVSLGHDDLESDDSDPVKSLQVDGHEFGWDNESPKRDAYVEKFRIDWRPVTNGQFYDFYKNGGQDKVSFPASWVKHNGEDYVCCNSLRSIIFFSLLTQVRTMYGPVSMKIARNWPVITSFDDFSTYAVVKGGRLPTDPELRLFYDRFEYGYEGGANWGFRNWHAIPYVYRSPHILFPW